MVREHFIKYDGYSFSCMLLQFLIKMVDILVFQLVQGIT